MKVIIADCITDRDAYKKQAYAVHRNGYDFPWVVGPKQGHEDIQAEKKIHLVAKFELAANICEEVASAKEIQRIEAWSIDGMQKA